MTQPGFQRKIDTIELSDAFRRHAQYPEQALVKEMVKQARHFAAATTWYNPAETWFHKGVTEKITKSVTRMAEIAAKLGADEIALPVTGDARSPFTKFFEQKILPTLDLPVKVTLQKHEYKKDLTKLGRIDRRIKTAIDEGVRGMADIDSNLKYKWDRNPRP
ncbi:MAG TPA: hypothetical protein VEF76_10415 [Patescibacteria group bacterium]|nr:hypothetical protein [Patescibacteria group bacterium]